MPRAVIYLFAPPVRGNDKDFDIQVAEMYGVDEVFEELDADEESSNALVPWQFVNFDHYHSARLPLRRLPFDVHLAINRFFVADSVVLEGELCRFDALASPLCAQTIDRLPTPHLLQLLAAILM